jgi:hypothetical protein
MDAATVYTHLLWEHGLVGHEPRQWGVKIACLTQSDMDGIYLSEADYNFLFGIAHNIQHALESADEVVREAREKIADKLARAVSPENTNPAGPSRKRPQKLPRRRISLGSQD